MDSNGMCLGTFVKIFDINVAVSQVVALLDLYLCDSSVFNFAKMTIKTG